MKKIVTSLVFIILLSGVIMAQNKDFKLSKKWSLGGFEAPESVVLDPKNKVLYLSNINGNPTEKDGNGYISKVALDGKIIKKKWIIGLDAPKGLSIYKGKMYVADIDKIIEINIDKGNILNKYSVPKATFLNDVTTDKLGNVYVSNTFGGESIIFRLSKGKITQWINDDALNLPNGILIKRNYMYVGSWGTDPDSKTFKTKTLGKVIKVSLKTKKITPLINNIGNMDGITETAHGFLFSDWMSGKLFYSKGGSSEYTEILKINKGSADIYFDKKNKTVYVPQMIDGHLDAYQITKSITAQ